MKDEVDRVEDKISFLNLDVDEQMTSFTPDKNGTPTNIQIILKTQEINKDNITDNTVDIEPSVVNHGIWYRIPQVFVEIWNGIKEIFK